MDVIVVPRLTEGCEILAGVAVEKQFVAHHLAGIGGGHLPDRKSARFGDVPKRRRIEDRIEET
jgi:hypothetical protein